MITAFLLNLRHTFYGPHIDERFPGMTGKDMYSIAPFLTDEIYALAVSEPKMEVSEIRKLGYFGYILWLVSSAFGIALTGGLPQFLYPILFLALPASFLALMVPRIKGNSTVVSAVASIGIAIVLRAYGIPEYSILISIVAGIAAGLLVLRAGGKK